MRLDLNAINEEIALGNVNRQVHPTFPLSIYKYSIACVFSRHWNEITLLCRGIVLDDFGNVVINSFPKFFNHSEGDGIEGYQSRKNSGMAYEVTDKMDGSLIQVCRCNDQVVIASSGSFTSPQALKAAELLKPHESYIKDGKSYLFEIIYPENRIVINYGDKVSLTLLAIRDTETGAEEHPVTVNILDCPLDVVSGVSLTLDEIEVELHRDAFINKEGYIVKFADGHRVKMKYDEYMRLHKIVSGVNEKYVWECLRDGVDIEAQLVNIPDELFQFVKTTKENFQKQFEEIKSSAYANYLLSTKFATRKEIAKWVFENIKSQAPLVFGLMDKKNIDKEIWKMIEPEFKRGLMGMGQSAEA